MSPLDPVGGRRDSVGLGDESLDAGVGLLDEGQHRLAIVLPLCQQLGGEDSFNVVPYILL